MILEKRLKGLCSVVSKDSSRSLLQGINFSGGKATASDGFVCIQTTTNEPASELINNQDDPHTPIEGTFKASQLLKILSLIPKKNLFTPYTSANKNGSVKFISPGEFGRDIVELKRIEGNFPAVEKVLQQQTPPVAKVRVNPNLLINFLKAFIETAENPKEIDIEIYSSDQPIRFETKDKKTIGVVMPVRISDF